jgi:iron-sulfur cluster insertion protein
MKYRTEFTSYGARVDKSKIKAPLVEFTEFALSQLRLILENDITLEDKWLRLVVSGKGCDGFDYSVGFTDYQEDDFQIVVQLGEGKQTFVLIDPFTAFYLQQVRINYVQDFANDEEGFVIEGLYQDEFKGKFWRANEEKTPPLLKHT